MLLPKSAIEGQTGLFSIKKTQLFFTVFFPIFCCLISFCQVLGAFMPEQNDLFSTRTVLLLELFPRSCMGGKLHLSILWIILFEKFVEHQFSDVLLHFFSRSSVFSK